MKLLKRHLLLLALVLISKLSVGQSFTTKASATTIGRNDVVQIEYVAEDAVVDQFVLPRFSKWTVVSGPNLSSSTIQTGNQIKQQISYSVMLQPTQPGTFTIPGATALINNKPQQSNRVTITVKSVGHLQGNAPPATTPRPSLLDPLPYEDQVPANQFLRKGEKAIDKIKNNIVVRLEINKKTCYVGEPILATYKLCTRLRSKSKVTRQPQFSGCTVIELTGDQQEAHIEKINGIDYNVFVIRKVELFPLEAGKLVLPATSVENKVTFYDGSRPSYRDLYYGAPSQVEEQLVTLQNKPDVVEVKPLPPFPTVGSSEFSGAIGNFNVSLSIADEGLTTNSTNHLYFTIEGQGNLQQARAPVIQWPKGIEAFDATEQVEDDKTGFPVKTRKTFSIPFVVDKKGDYTIPAVQFTYFDATANKYITKTTSGLLMRIAQGKKTLFAKSTKAGPNEGLGFDERLYILLGAGLLAVIIGLVWFSRGPKTPLQPVSKVPVNEDKPVAVKQPESAEFLYKIRELQPDSDSSLFYKSLCRNLQAYLGSKYGIQAGQLAFFIDQHPEIATELGQLKALLDDCGLGMYTPVFTREEAMQHRLTAIEVLCRLEKE